MAYSKAGLVRSNTRLLSAAGTTNATLVKNDQGTLWHITGYNAAASARYLKLYDKASAPTVGTDTPAYTFYLPAQSAFRLDWEKGRYFSIGIGFGLTTARDDNSTAAVTAGDIECLNIEYD